MPTRCEKDGTNGQIWTWVRAILVVTCALIGIGLSALATYADEPLPHPRAVWREPIITYAVVLSSANGDTVGATPGHRSAVAGGVSQWDMALRGIVIFKQAPSAESADVLIVLVDKDDGRLSAACAGGKRQVGVTRTQFDPATRTLKHAICWINGDLSDDALAAVVAHEWGHALGLTHHSVESDDVMFPCLHLPALLTDRDRAAVRELYSAAQ